MYKLLLRQKYNMVKKAINEKNFINDVRVYMKYNLNKSDAINRICASDFLDIYVVAESFVKSKSSKFWAKEIVKSGKTLSEDEKIILDALIHDEPDKKVSKVIWM